MFVASPVGNPAAAAIESGKPGGITEAPPNVGVGCGFRIVFTALKTGFLEGDNVGDQVTGAMEGYDVLGVLVGLLDGALLGRLEGVLEG
mmetsp:Transcript_7639/g.11684  ORF Transcript_7639/g.11684 Transcript_7639/m.11684 type:complete len:89 (-) Transcript_7639:1579-1845(-)